MSTRLNKNDFAAILVAKELYPTKAAALAAIEVIFPAIADIVIAGDSLAIPDFGKFEAYTRLNGKVKPKFTPFGTFKDSVGNG